MVHKLESMSFDIKYYINANATISNKSFDNLNEFMNDEVITELVEIRNRIKRVIKKLENKPPEGQDVLQVTKPALNKPSWCRKDGECSHLKCMNPDDDYCYFA